MHTIKQIQAEQFQTEVVSSSQPVLVDFYATWCPPCGMIVPMLENLAEQYDGRVKFVKMNVADAPDIVTRYGVQGVPTLLCFNNGAIVDSMVGMQPTEMLQERLDRVVPVGE